MDTQVQTILKEIRAQLARRGMKQVDLADYWLVSSSTASRLINGKLTISLEQTMQAASLFGLSLSELLYLAKVNNPQTS